MMFWPILANFLTQNKISFKVIVVIDSLNSNLYQEWDTLLNISPLQRISFSLNLFSRHGCRIPPFIKASEILRGDQTQKKELAARLLNHFVVQSSMNNVHQNEDMNRIGGILTVFLDSSSDFSDPMINWFNFVSQKYETRVNNLYTDLADGKIFCFVLHYYFPSLVNFKLIQDSKEEQESFNYDSIQKFYSFTPYEKVRQIKILKLRKNFKIIEDALEKIGGVPFIRKFFYIKCFC
jgi:hypothetical protein